MESRYTWKNQLVLGLRNFAITAVVIFTLVYLIVISGQAAREELQEMFVEERSEITYIDEPVAYGYEEGAKIWEVRSQYAEEEEESESSDLTRIYELILFKGGEENVLIRGDFGHWDKPREKLTLTGNVVVESADNTTFLMTEKLIWEERTKTLVCPEFVDFWVEDNHVIANSLYSADDLATIDFIGDVEMFVIGLEGENFITREGDFPIESIEDEEPGEGMNVLAEYVHYDKGDKVSWCYAHVPLDVRNQHNLDEEGRLIEDDGESPFAGFGDPLDDPEFVEALQRSIAEMDLTPDERAFLEGQINFFELNSPSAIGEGHEIIDSEGGTLDLSALDPGGSTVPLGGMMPGTGLPGTTAPIGGTPDETPGPVVEPGEFTDLGPEVIGPYMTLPPQPLNLPKLPVSDPNLVLSAPDYSAITEWEIATDIEAELFEGDPNFDPYSEIRPDLVFCYRNDTKIWCEEMVIDMGVQQVDALRRADARFRNLRDEDREPAEGRAGRAIQESPTQLLGNYLSHYWKDNVTLGYDRVLAIQKDKDIEADNIGFYEDSDVIHAWGDVIAHQYSGEWWEESGAIEDIDDERAREDVKNPTVIRSDAMLSYNERVSWAFGNVVFLQEEQTVRGERAQYEDDTQMLVMAGDVDYSNEDGEQLACALLTMDLYMEEYIAEGAAIARNIVPEEYRDNLEDFRKDEEDRVPEDDARTRLLENRTAAGLGDWSDAIDHPPPLPPIEILDGGADLGALMPDLGPEIPSPTAGLEQPESDEPVDIGDLLMFEESNTDNVVPQGVAMPGGELSETSDSSEGEDESETEVNDSGESTETEESEETEEPAEEEEAEEEAEEEETDPPGDTPPGEEEP